MQKYQHEISKHPQHSPYPTAPKKYGSAEQDPTKKYDSKSSGTKGINHVQNVVDSILYFETSVDPTILMALPKLASEQSKVTTQTINNLYQFLDYLGTHPDKTI